MISKLSIMLLNYRYDHAVDCCRCSEVTEEAAVCIGLCDACRWRDTATRSGNQQSIGRRFESGADLRSTSTSLLAMPLAYWTGPS